MPLNKPRTLTVSSAAYHGTKPLANERERARVPIQFTSPLQWRDDELCVIRVQNCSIPLSFYGVDDATNQGIIRLTYTSGVVTTVDRTFTVAEGNYSALLFRTALQTAIDAAFASEIGAGTLPTGIVQITYSTTANKYTFKTKNDPAFPGLNLQAQFLIGKTLIANSIHRAMGFFDRTTPTSTFTTTVGLTSERPVILAANTTGNLYINTSLSNAYKLPIQSPAGAEIGIAVDSSFLLQVVPIDQPANTYLNMDSINFVNSFVYSGKQLSQFEIYILNQDSQLVNFQGLNWSMVLEFSFVQLTSQEMEGRKQLVDRKISSQTIERIEKVLNPLKRPREEDTVPGETAEA